MTRGGCFQINEWQINERRSEDDQQEVKSMVSVGGMEIECHVVRRAIPYVATVIWRGGRGELIKWRTTGRGWDGSVVTVVMLRDHSAALEVLDGTRCRSFCVVLW